MSTIDLVWDVRCEVEYLPYVMRLTLPKLVLLRCKRIIVITGLLSIYPSAFKGLGRIRDASCQAVQVCCCAVLGMLLPTRALCLETSLDTGHSSAVIA